jgi:hypothetical protein
MTAPPDADMAQSRQRLLSANSGHQPSPVSAVACVKACYVFTGKVGRAGMTKGKFGFHQGGGKHEPSLAAGYVQIYVKRAHLVGLRILQFQFT